MKKQCDESCLLCLNQGSFIVNYRNSHTVCSYDSHENELSKASVKCIHCSSQIITKSKKSPKSNEKVSKVPENTTNIIIEKCQKCLFPKDQLGHLPCGHIVCDDCLGNVIGIRKSTFVINVVKNLAKSSKCPVCENPDNLISCNVCEEKFSIKVDFECKHNFCNSCYSKCAKCSIGFCSLCWVEDKDLCKDCFENSACSMCFSMKIGTCKACRRKICKCEWLKNFCSNCFAHLCLGCIKEGKKEVSFSCGHYGCVICQGHEKCKECSESGQGMIQIIGKSAEKLRVHTPNPSIWINSEKNKALKILQSNKDEKLMKNRKSLNMNLISQQHGKSEIFLGNKKNSQNPIEKHYNTQGKVLTNLPSFEKFKGQIIYKNIPYGQKDCKGCFNPYCKICMLSSSKCSFCNKITLTKPSACGHTICNDCQTSNLSCKICNLYTCDQCGLSTENLHKKFFCSHKLCTSCFSKCSNNIKCTLCNKKPCPSCGQMNEITKKLQCGHESCDNCNKINACCFPCLFDKKVKKFTALIKRINSCFVCKESRTGYVLSCEHCICLGCFSSISAREFNYVCLDCCLKNDRVCVKCCKKSVWEISYDKGLVHKLCCKTKFCALCLQKKGRMNNLFGCACKGKNVISYRKC